MIEGIWSSIKDNVVLLATCANFVYVVWSVTR